MGKALLGGPLIKKYLRTVQKNRSAQRASLAAWGPGARLRAPVGSRGKVPGGVPGGECEAPGSSCVFQCRNNIFNANL